MADHGNITTPDAGDLDTAARKYAASQGWAMDDGSYPIRPLDNHGKTDLQKAIHAVGRGSGSHAAIRRHIMSRAKTLGLSDEIPDDWQAEESPRSATPGGTLYRSFTPDLEVRAGGDGRTIVGIAVPYDVDQRIDSRLVERFARGAFNEQIRAAVERVRGVGMPANRVPFAREHMARGGTLIGTTRVLRDDAAGLYGEWRVSATPSGDETLELVRDGALSQLSIGFREGHNRRSRGGVTERVTAELREVAVVMEGAYGEQALVSAVRQAGCMCGCHDGDGRGRLEEAKRVTAALPMLPA